MNKFTLGVSLSAFRRERLTVYQKPEYKKPDLCESRLTLKGGMNEPGEAHSL